MYYDDHLAVAEKLISSRNFCALVDAAVRLYHEEDDRLLLTKKTKYNCHTMTFSKKEEEEIDCLGFLNLVPRQKRSVKKYVTKRRVPSQFHENLNMEMKNPQNPNSQSSPSPSSCVTEEKGRKRRAVQETNPNGKSKKAKVGPLSWKGRETPERLIQLMENMGGDNLKLIFEKTLTPTDCNPHEGRLSMPVLSLIRRDFLTLEETTILEKDIQSKIKTGFGVILFDERGVRRDLKLKRWETNSKRSFNYALVCGWKDVVEANGFKGGVSISVWTFRCGQGRLCFALFPPPTTV